MFSNIEERGKKENFTIFFYFSIMLFKWKENSPWMSHTPCNVPSNISSTRFDFTMNKKKLFLEENAAEINFLISILE